MTQSIIPGCEANPDPTTVINVDPTKPMKEIQMDETKTNLDNDDAFQKFIAAGSAIVQSGRELMEDNAKLRKDNMDLVGTVQQLTARALNAEAESARLRKENERLVADGVAPEDYQTLKDFKAEMDAIHEEFGIPHDVEELRKVLSEWKTCRDACDSNRVEPDELNEKLEELDAIKDVMDNKDISDADDLENYLDECADFQKYKRGFEELADFVEKLKEVIGSNGDDIPSTDVEDYD